jgi:hypothetical protein
MSIVAKKHKLSGLMAVALVHTRSTPDGGRILSASVTGRTAVALASRDLVGADGHGRWVLTDKGAQVVAELVDERREADDKAANERADERSEAVELVDERSEAVELVDERSEADTAPEAPKAPFRPAYKTVVDVRVAWTLEARRDASQAWSYVSDHVSEEDATHRALGLLADGSRMQYRVVEHRTEKRVTDVIKPPAADGPRYTVLREGGTDGRHAVYDTTTRTIGLESWSLYAATQNAVRKNAEEAGRLNAAPRFTVESAEEFDGFQIMDSRTGWPVEGFRYFSRYAAQAEADRLNAL